MFKGANTGVFGWYGFAPHVDCLQSRMRLCLAGLSIHFRYPCKCSVRVLLRCLDTLSSRRYKILDRSGTTADAREILLFSTLFSFTTLTMSYIPLSQRTQWSDLVPIPQNDGPTPLVPIMYSEECEQTKSATLMQTATQWTISAHWSPRRNALNVFST